MKTFCLTLDLKDDPRLIQEYEDHHKQVWPEIIDSIRGSGIEKMDIYRLGNRLVMVIEARDDFSFAKKEQLDRDNPKVVEWEALMWKYQQPLKDAREGEKWLVMEKIFSL